MPTTEPRYTLDLRTLDASQAPAQFLYHCIREFRRALIPINNEEARPPRTLIILSDSEYARLEAIDRYYSGDLFRHFFCERCLDHHGKNPQSVSCYCECHSSVRDEARWPALRGMVASFFRERF